MRRPRNSNGVHFEFVLQDVSSKKRVLPARTWHDTVISSIRGSVPIAQIPEFIFPALPIDLLLARGDPAGITNPVSELDCLLLNADFVKELNRRIRSLI